MNSVDIVTMLNADSICRQNFQGVFSADTLPSKPRLLVCNTDPSSKPGRHWIAIYVDEDGRGEYFDSFGRSPEGDFENYMNEHCREWVFNKKQLQSVISSFCGFYCCMYCLFRCRGVDLNGIVNVFTNDTAFNDSLVHSFVCNKILENYLSSLSLLTTPTQSYISSHFYLQRKTFSHSLAMISLKNVSKLHFSLLNST
jgi:hypothetical protein